MSVKTNYIKRTDLIPLSVLHKILVIVEDGGEVSRDRLAADLAGYSAQTIASSIGRLRESQWIEERKHGLLRMTRLGDRYLGFRLGAIQMFDQPWDHTVFLLAARIPRDLQTKRDVFRKFLLNHGYGHVLDGGWIHPRPNLNHLDDEIVRLGIGERVLRIPSKKLEPDAIARMIQWGWRWDRLERTFTEFSKRYRPIVSSVLDPRSQLTPEEKRLIGKWVVLAYGKLLETHPNFPDQLLPQHRRYVEARLLYQDIRPYCYR